MEEKDIEKEELKKQLKEELLKEMLEEKKAEETKEEVKEEPKEIKTTSKINYSDKKAKPIEEIEFDVIWEDKPAGLIQRLLTKINMNFTTYQITKDELIIIKGFFSRKLNTVELYLLKDPDYTDNIYQRWLDIGTITVKVDTHVHGEGENKPARIIKLSNIKNGQKVRKLLRDAIEDDVMERKITYFDKV